MRRRFFTRQDSDSPMYIEALADDFSFKLKHSASVKYRINDGPYTELLSDNIIDNIKLGDKVFIIGYLTYSVSNYNSFTFNADCHIGGNILSLVYGDSYRNYSKLQNSALRNLFRDNENLLSVGKEFLCNITTLAENCYYSMFYGCSNLVNAPELPSTTLANSCYADMFYGCTSLTTAPELPATTLANGCYRDMFYGCTSLTAAPELPATTLLAGCYQNMFSNCTCLTTAPELSATTLANSCYDGMFSNCTGLTTAPELPATTLADYCYSNMFSNCIGLTAAPELPATTLAGYCYERMFYGCTGLTTAPELPATTLVHHCYYSMFYMCTSLTTAPELPATTLADYCYSNMFNSCNRLTYIKMLVIEKPPYGCLLDWVTNVALLGTFVKNSAMTTLPTGVNGIPEGWSVISDDQVNEGAELITFKILDAHTAEKGMTWAEWCDSNYNIADSAGGVYRVSMNKITRNGLTYVALNGTIVNSTETIVSGAHYNLLSDGDMGGGSD